MNLNYTKFAFLLKADQGLTELLNAGLWSRKSYFRLWPQAFKILAPAPISKKFLAPAPE